MIRYIDLLWGDFFNFKGVATKYLDNYLAWFLFVDSRSNESDC